MYLSTHSSTHPPVSVYENQCDCVWCATQGVLDSIESVAIMEFVLNEWQTLKKYADSGVHGGAAKIVTIVRQKTKLESLRLPDCWCTVRHTSSREKFCISGTKIINFINETRQNTKLRQKIRSHVDVARRDHYNNIFRA